MAMWRVFTKTREKSLLNFAGNTFTAAGVRSGRVLVPAKDKSLVFARKYSKMTTLKFVKLSKNAHTPMRGSKLAAGYDLCSAYDYTIPAKEKQLCLTDLQISLPEGCYGRIAPRSGLAHKHFIDVGAGVIDYDYRGNVGVILFNFGNEEFKVCRGDRIAQIICERIFYPDIEEVSSIDDTERGNGGYGSTGKN